MRVLWSLKLNTRLLSEKLLFSSHIAPLLIVSPRYTFWFFYIILIYSTQGKAIKICHSFLSKLQNRKSKKWVTTISSSSLQFGYLLLKVFTFLSQARCLCCIKILLLTLSLWKKKNVGYPPNDAYPPPGYPQEGYPPQGYPRDAQQLPQNHGGLEGWYTLFSLLHPTIISLLSYCDSCCRNKSGTIICLYIALKVDLVHLLYCHWRLYPFEKLRMRYDNIIIFII